MMQDPDKQELTETHTFTPTENSDALAQVLDNYMAAIKAGNPPTHEELKAANPELANELDSCLEGIDFLHGNGKSVPNEMGDFQLLSTIGSGGMGVVYEARQISLDRIVALKVMRPGILDEEALQRFAREAETAAGLHHPNIVPIHAVGQHDGIHYYAMQRIEGQSLAERARSNPSPNSEEETTARLEPVSAETVAEWGLQAAQALAHAHIHGVIHRDVKPSNLILDPESNVWLTDFGLAKRLEDAGTATMTGAILGTPRYMSPEQATHTEVQVDHRTDIYSLGATLYELVTGTPVFDAATPLKLIDQIRREEPELPTRRNRKVPMDLEAILMKCLAKQPRDRYATAGDLAKDLQAFCDGNPISARRITPIEQSRRWVVHNWSSLRWAVSAVAFAAALILASTWISSEYSRLSLGELKLTSRTGPLVASVVDTDGNLVTAQPFALPTMTAVEIPEGDYRVQLRGEGESNQHFDISIAGGQQSSFAVEPLTLRGWKHDKANVAMLPFLFSDTESGIIEIGRDTITRLRSDDGSKVWERELKEIEVEPRVLDIKNPNLDTYKAPAGQKLLWSWKRQQVAPWRGNQRALHFLSSAPDIDGDGVNDLILPGRGVPALLALSGKTGKPIWTRAYYFAGATSYNSNLVRESIGVADLVPCRDLDDDGVADLITTLVVNDRTTVSTVWYVAGISAATGDVLWKHKPKPMKSGFNSTYPDTTFWTDSDIYYRPVTTSRFMNHVVREDVSFPQNDRGKLPQPLLKIKNGDESLIVVCNSKRLEFLNPKTGNVKRSFDLGTVPLAAPVVGNLVEGGFPELLVMTHTTAPAPNATFTPNTLSAYSVTNGLLWKQDFSVDRDWLVAPGSSGPDWPIVADIDGDGTDEVLTANDHAGQLSTNGVFNYRVPISSITLLDGQTGKPRWEKYVRTRNIDQQNNRMIVTDDLDLDGVADFATATLFAVPQKWTAVFVDTFSGADGTPLRLKKIVLSSEAARASLDSLYITGLKYRNDAGKKIIGVNVSQSRVGESEPFAQTYQFDVMTGHIISESVGIQNGVTLAAMESSDASIPGAFATRDIFIQKDVPTLSRGVSRFHIKDPYSSYRWRRLGFELTVTDDLDGDGIQDVVGLNRNASNSRPSSAERQQIGAFSSASGRAIWLKQLSYSQSANMVVVDDLDQDGANDLMLLPLSGSGGGTPEIWSAKTGRPLKKVDLSYAYMDSPSQPLRKDLNADGVDEIVFQVSYNSGTNVGFGQLMAQGGMHGELMCFDIAAGRVLWQFPFTKDYWSHNPLPYALMASGDDIQLFMLVMDPTNSSAKLVSLDAKTGRTKWERKTLWTAHYFQESSHSIIHVLSDEDGAKQLAFLDAQGGVNGSVKLTWKIFDPESGAELGSIDTPIDKHAYRSGGSSCAVLRKKEGRGEELAFAFKDRSTRGKQCWIIGKQDEKWNAHRKFTLEPREGKRSPYELVIDTIDVDPNSDVFKDEYEKSKYENALVYSGTSQALQCRFADSDKDVWYRDIGIRFNAVRSTPNRELLLLSRTESDLRLLSGVNGEPIWRSYLPFPRKGRFYSTFPSLLHGENGELPFVLLKHSDNDFVAIENKHIRTKPTDNSQISAIVSNLDQDDRRVELFGFGGQKSGVSSVVFYAIRTSTVTLFALLIPLFYVLHTIRRAQFSMQWLMIAPVVTTAALLALRLAPVNGGWGSNSVGWVAYFISGTVPIAYIGMLIWLAAKKRWFWIGVIFGITFGNAFLVGTISVFSAQALGNADDAYRVSYRTIAFLFLYGIYGTGILIAMFVLFKTVVGALQDLQKSINDRFSRRRQRQVTVSR